MKKGMKRTLLAFMVMAMLASSAAVPVMASDPTGGGIPGSSSSNPDGEGGDENGYGVSLFSNGEEETDALTDKQLPKASDGKITITESGKYTLTDAVTYPIVVSSSIEVTLDLNGQNVTVTGSDAITNNGTLTIIGSGTVDAQTHGKAALINTGNVTINGGTFNRSQEQGSSSTDNGGNSFYYIWNKSGTMTLNTCSVPGISAYSSTVRNDGIMYINDGASITGKLIAVKNDSGTLYVNGGQIDGGGDQAIQNWSTATISGGSMTGSVATWGWNNNGTVNAGHTTIEGGNVQTAMTVSYNALPDDTTVPTLEIKGNAQIDKVVSTRTNNSYENTYGKIVISGQDVTIGEVKNFCSSSDTTIQNATVDKITNSAGGTITVDKDSTVTGDITGSVTVSPLAEVTGTNNSTSTTTYTVKVTFNGQTTEYTEQTWEQAVVLIEDRYGYTKTVSENGTIITVVYTAGDYMVTFEGLGSYSYSYQDTIRIPEGPSVSGFIGWSDGSRLWYPGDLYTVTGNASFEAVFETVSEPYIPSTPIEDGIHEYSLGKMLYIDGKRVKGLYTYAGATYYFDERGFMQTGWVELESGWYHFAGDGRMQTGWLKLGNTWYYLDPATGRMYDDGLAAIGKYTYYFYDWGGMANSWWYEDENGDWYFFGGDGAMKAACWVEWKGEYYYLTETGKMAVSCYIGDYYVNADGVWVR